MVRTNRPLVHEPVRTHEGGRAERQKPLTELTRAVSTCLLFENTFYESGSDIAKRIAELCEKVSAVELSALAVKARTDLKLRHVPLFIVRQMARLHRGSSIVSHTLEQVIQRPDEMGEFLSLYWKDEPRGKTAKLSAQVRKGLARAFGKFDEYQLSKWDRDSAIKLRDVAFLVRPKAVSAERGVLYAKLFNKNYYPEKTKSGFPVKSAYQLGDFESLQAPDTWEVALSAGKNKKETFERLLKENKLGYIALLMNLRNMEQASCDHALVEASLIERSRGSKALPFRFVSAAKAAPSFADAVSTAMLEAIDRDRKLAGKTLLVIDVSGSMDVGISAKSQINRWEAAGALGVLIREIADECRVFTFSHDLIEVANYRGLPLIHGVGESQPHGGTYLEGALTKLQQKHPSADRIIIITDEQAHDGISKCWARDRRGYIVNVAPYAPGLETGGSWTRINGWSERLIDWIFLEESQLNG